MPDTLDIRLTTDWAEVDPQAFHAVYYSVDFFLEQTDNLPADFMATNFGPGVFGFFAYHNNTLVGVARVLSDDSMVSFVAELCVHKDWQRKGIGTQLMKAVIERFDGTAIYVDAFVGQEDFFRGQGIPTQSMLVACGRAPNGIPPRQAKAA